MTRRELRRERVRIATRRISVSAGRLNEGVQVNWFTAACKTVQRYHMRGVFFFKVDLTDNPAHPASSLSTFEGREGAAAIGECARILR